MDTVSANGCLDLFRGVLQDGIIKGRGACDDKGPMAALFATLAALKQESVKIPWDLTVAATVDEENSMAGAAHLAHSNPDGWDLCLALEPSLLRPISSHIGIYRCRVLPRGSQVDAKQLLDQLHHDILPLKSKVESPHHPKLGSAVMTITELMEDGPPRLLVDVRLLPHQSPGLIHRQINKIIGQRGRVIPLFSALGIDSPPDNPYISALRDSLKRHELDHETIGVFFPSDCSQLRNHGSCLVWGPGDFTVAHTPEESIEVGQLEKACAVLYDFLSQNPPPRCAA